MKRFIYFTYGLICYLLFVASVVYLMAFVGNLYLTNTLDSAPKIALNQALLINLGLFLLFGLQHSLMARQGFKNWWREYLPQPIERSTYVLFSSIALVVLLYYWQPLGGPIWKVKNHLLSTVLYTIFFLGWILVFLATVLINHFDLFGLRQVYLYLRQKPYSALKMETPALYKNIRHPLYLGFLIAFWATPTMTISHLFFAVAMTIYVLIGIQLEERDLIADFGKVYINYRKKVPMLLPFWNKKE